MTAKIFHTDLFGPRKDKYDALLDGDLHSMEWQELSPNAPFYLFVPQEQLHREEYEAGWPINDIFPVNSMGITTGNDEKYVAFTIDELKSKLGSYVDKNFALVAYRLFDDRILYYDADILARARVNIMKHMNNPVNIALVALRRPRSQFLDNFFITRHITDKNYISSLDNAYVFPLFLFPASEEMEMGLDNIVNINRVFAKELKSKLTDAPTPEDIFHYAYAVFHAPAYRTRYAAFLKTDFPRLPLPPNDDAFTALAALGAKLVALHLLEASELAQHNIEFPVAGDHTVLKMKDAVRYVPPTDGKPGRVKLNTAEYFDNVPPEAWEFQVGGYRPASKWLADREGRALTAQDIDHYRRTLAALRDTAALLPQVDVAFVAAFPISLD